MHYKNKQKLNLVVTLIAVLIFLCGAGIFLYPLISNGLAEKHQSDVIQDYQKHLNDEDKSFYASEMQKAREYNESLVGDPVHDPFVPGTGYALPDNYLDCLNIDGIMGYIEIPKIQVKLPIYHGTSSETLEKGVGHIESTTLPIGGDFTHSVLTGHRGLPSAKLFTDLDQLKVGDRFYIHVLDQVLAYEVDQIQIILPEEMQVLSNIPGRDLITLVTCTPYGVNTHRLLVRGTRIPYIPEEAETYKKTVGLVSVFGTDMPLQSLGIAVGLVLLTVMILMLIWIRKRRLK